MTEQFGRGTPVSVHVGLLKLLFVFASFFINVPALLSFALTALGDGGGDRYVMACLIGGGLVWAISTFMASTVWTSLGFGIVIVIALQFAPKGPLVPKEVLLEIGAVFGVAALMGTRRLGKLDVIAAGGAVAALVQASKASGVRPHIVMGVDVFRVIDGAIAASLLATPTLLGQWIVDSLFSLLFYLVVIPGSLGGLVLSILARDSTQIVMGIVVILAVLGRLISPPLCSNLIASETSRGTRWLLAALLATFKLASTPSSSPILNPLILVLTGASASLILTSFLSYTSHSWKPVRSTEFQMVTVDFMALCFYFVFPLCALTYKFWHEAPLPPFKHLMIPSSYPTEIPIAIRLILGFVTAQQAYQVSSTLWAHWLVPTFILGAVDTKQVALVATLEDLKTGVDKVEEVVGAIKSSGLVVNVFVSQEEAQQHQDVLKKLKAAETVLGVQTWAGALSLPSRAANNVRAAYDALSSVVGAPLYYHGQGGHRNPWALAGADRLGLRHISPVLSLPLGSDTITPSTLLDKEYKGGVVLLQVGGKKGGNLESRLKKLASQLETSGYSSCPLQDLCADVKKMII